MGFGSHVLLEVLSLPRELENKTVAGVFPEQSWVLKETLNSDGCSWQLESWGHLRLPAWGLQSGAWFPGEGVGENGEHLSS